MKKTVLLIATFDTKESEAVFLKESIESRGISVITMDTGILAPPNAPVDFEQKEVAEYGGMSLEKALATGDKGACILNMTRGAELLCKITFTQRSRVKL